MFSLRWHRAWREMAVLRRWTDRHGVTWTSWLPVSYWVGGR